MDFIWRILTTYSHVSLRYFALADGAFALFYGLRRRHLAPRKIQRPWPRRADYWREIRYSLLSIGVFSIVAYATFQWLRPYTQLYDRLTDRPLWYYGLSLVLMLGVHDTYFYWAHRLMHHPRVFRHVHRVHHQSTNPSPWAAYAFHPFEALLEAAVIPLIALLVPAHQSAVVGFLLFQFAYNVYGHLGFELLPAGWGSWLNTSRDHNLHHQKVAGNYGLYTSFWDRLMGTRRPDA